MIIGAHAIVYSKDSEADRRFFQDVLGLKHVDAGNGWLIFGLPPAEVAVHPSKTSVAHELYLMTEDVTALVATLKKRGILCTPPVDQRWGVITQVTLPSGGKISIYEPRHTRPDPVVVPASKKPVPIVKPTEPAAAPPPKSLSKAVVAKPAAAKSHAPKAAVKAAAKKAAPSKAPAKPANVEKSAKAEKSAKKRAKIR